VPIHQCRAPSGARRHATAPRAPARRRLLLRAHKAALRATAAFWRAAHGDVAFSAMTRCLKRIEAAR
jgi:hypothetical protein